MSCRRIDINEETAGHQIPGFASLPTSARLASRNDTRAVLSKSANCLRASSSGRVDRSESRRCRDSCGLGAPDVRCSGDVRDERSLRPGGFRTDGIKKTMCPCGINQIIVWVNLTFRHRVCGKTIDSSRSDGARPGRSIPRSVKGNQGLHAGIV